MTLTASLTSLWEGFTSSKQCWNTRVNQTHQVGFLYARGEFSFKTLKTGKLMQLSSREVSDSLSSFYPLSLASEIVPNSPRREGKPISLGNHKQEVPLHLLMRQAGLDTGARTRAAGSKRRSLVQSLMLPINSSSPALCAFNAKHLGSPAKGQRCSKYPRWTR